MKIMFFFNWEFSNFCHALAKFVKNKYEDASFCGVVVQKKDLPALQNQKDVDYELVVLRDIFNKYKEEKVDDEFLKKLEKEYGNPYLLEMVYSDREIVPPFASNSYSHDDVKKMIQVLFKGFEEFIDRTKPDYFMFDCIASLPSFVLYAVAKKKGVKPIGFTYSRVEDRCYFVSNPYDNPEAVIEAFEKIRKTGKRPKEAHEQALDFLKRFRTADLKPKYIQNLPISEKKVFSARHYFLRFFEYWWQYYLEDQASEYNLRGKTPFNRTLEKITQVGRKMRYKDFFERPDYNEEFVYYPLHLDPELATMVQGPPYVDQLNLIRLIARSIPITCRLYVKEHPLMYKRGWRATGFYKELKRIPNVKLIDPTVSSRDIIKNAKLVFSITGTVGFETILHKKPVLVFGDCVYSPLSFIGKNVNPMQLPQTIQSLIAQYKHDEEELVDFLTAIYEKSIGVDLSLLFGYVYPDITADQIAKLDDFKRLASYICSEIFDADGRA